jgi:RNA polymerase sigma-70 factor, ECF subfamily
VDPNDQSLIDAINRGPPEDRPAFEQMYRRHRAFVYRIALRFSRNPTAAADIMQNTFLAFWGKFPGFVLQGRVTTFLYAVTRNCAMQERRKSPSLEPVGEVQTIHNFPAEFAPLRAAVQNLPEPQQEVLLMRIVDEMSVSEVAIALGIPTGTVKSRLHTALETLRQDHRASDYFQDSTEKPENH